MDPDSLAQELLARCRPSDGHVRAIYLVGSQALGYAVSTSDVDLRVVLSKGYPPDDQRVVRRAARQLVQEHEGAPLEVVTVPWERLLRPAQVDLKWCSRLLVGQAVDHLVPEPTVDERTAAVRAGLHAKFLPRLKQPLESLNPRELLAVISWLSHLVVLVESRVIPRSKRASFERAAQLGLSDGDLFDWAWSELRPAEEMNALAASDLKLREGQIRRLVQMYVGPDAA